MSEYFHSVRLIENRCKGCVICAKRCPTEAIRIRGGQSQIIEARCIDCGECIRRCPAHAKTAVTESLDDLNQYKFNIALPAPTLYAQFAPDIRIDTILSALMEIGFDDIFEVAQGAEIVSLAIKDYLKSSAVSFPIISSACPAVVRLIQVKFPELIDNLVPIDAPTEVAGRVARARASRKHGIHPDEIGIWFITPCPAKMTAVKQPLGSEKSNITGAIGISEVYGRLLKAVQDVPAGVERRHASWVGVNWAISGGESLAVGIDKQLIVHEINNVNDILEQVALGKLAGVNYIEALACAGGCIGGPLTIQNRFVAEVNMKLRAENMKAEDTAKGRVPLQEYRESALGANERRAIEPRPILRLDEDIFKAMYKVEVMEKTLQQLPGLDCGSCGSPNCKALAEDIAQGKASSTDCVFKLRERVRDLAKEMIDLAEKLPPSLDKDSS
ncbi:Electron transport complex subunit RsxB [bioreactor metagenome]|uniref:Electron transport complex subunit RsxB n=1 Tax=bioreactor metagenome TaxID=1076179 RepID=A0A644T948_9ZZZZ|nr:[Fe-Fe] hydrogenase large subunit C-terminal domain-containing protein [Negativicutes bacterium]